MRVKKKQQYPEVIVSALVKNKKGQILLIKSPKWGNRFTPCGGHVELGEKMEVALVREVKEEIGLKIKVCRLLKIHETIYPREYWKKKHFIIFNYLCEAKNQRLKLDNREAKDFIWVSPQKALKLFIDKYTRQTILEYLKLLKK